VHYFAFIDIESLQPIITPSLSIMRAFHKSLRSVLRLIFLNAFPPAENLPSLKEIHCINSNEQTFTVHL